MNYLKSLRSGGKSSFQFFPYRNLSECMNMRIWGDVCLYLCVCGVYAGTHICLDMCVHQMSMLVSSSTILFGGAGSFRSWSRSSWVFLSPLPNAGIYGWVTAMDTEDPNSGLHACIAITSPSEPLNHWK